MSILLSFDYVHMSLGFGDKEIKVDPCLFQELARMIIITAACDIAAVFRDRSGTPAGHKLPPLSAWDCACCKSLIDAHG